MFMIMNTKTPKNLQSKAKGVVKLKNGTVPWCIYGSKGAVWDENATQLSGINYYKVSITI